MKYLSIYLCHLWFLSPVSYNFLILSSGFSMYSIMPSANSDLDSSFLIWVSFISFSSLIAVTKTSKTILNSSGESGHPCLVPDFRGNAFNFSPLRMFAVGLSYIAFIILSYVPSISAFWRVFFFLLSWMDVEFCQRLSLHLLR